MLNTLFNRKTPVANFKFPENAIRTENRGQMAEEGNGTATTNGFGDGENDRSKR